MKDKHTQFLFNPTEWGPFTDPGCTLFVKHLTSSSFIFSGFCDLIFPMTSYHRLWFLLLVFYTDELGSWVLQSKASNATYAVLIDIELFVENKIQFIIS